MKKTISRIGCFLLAILLGLYSVAIPADADCIEPRRMVCHWLLSSDE